MEEYDLWKLVAGILCSAMRIVFKMSISGLLFYLLVAGIAIRE